MPYPNEHACRIKDPDGFTPGSFRRIERGEGSDKLSIIIGRPKGQTTTTTQAYRYDKETWTEARAKEHCTDEGGSFEAAIEEEQMIDVAGLDTIAKAYAAHNRLHAEYVDARWGARRKVQMQEDHEAVVRCILDLGGRHIPHGEALDMTLPDELKDAFKLAYITNTLILAENTNRSKIQILRTGTFHHPEYGKFTITQDTLDAMASNFAVAHPKPPTEMVVDWEHLSVTDPPQKSPAAGWVKAVIATDGELFAEVEWTDEAASEIRKQEYRFISPEFNLNYPDKETGKRIGPTLLSVALTNRPFIEGMQPVALSDLMSMVFVEESIDERINAVRNAFYAQFRGEMIGPSYDYISEVYDDVVIVEHGGELFKLPYSRDDESGKITFDTVNQVKVRLTKTYDEIQLSGATSLNQTPLSPNEKAKAAAVKAGGGKYSETKLKEERALKEEICKLLGLDETADDAEVVKAIGALKASSTDAATKLTEAEQARAKAVSALTEYEIDKVVDDALTTGKLTPKMVEWAKGYALADREGFTAYLETAEKVGPDLTVKGKAGNEGDADIQLTEAEETTGKKLGVSKEKAIAFKQAEATKS